jgi:Mrp family chromosome partitioning ATPase
VTSNLPDSRRAREAFRALAERTWGQVRKGMPTGTATVAITSAEVGTGKSFVSINLGLSLSKALGARVLLIEGDLRRSRLHCYLNFDRQASTVRQFVEWNLDWPSLVISRVPGTTLDVLPAGSPQKEDLLVGDKLQSLLSQAKRAYDIVLVDCPPIPVASALRIATHCDYSIVVVRREFTRKNDLAATLTELGPDKVLGVVFGDDESPTSRIYDYY